MECSVGGIITGYVCEGFRTERAAQDRADALTATGAMEMGLS